MSEAKEERTKEEKRREVEESGLRVQFDKMDREVRAWEAMVLVTLFVCLMGFVVVSNEIDLKPVNQVPAQGATSVADVLPYWRIWENPSVPEVKEVQDGRLVSKPQWYDGLASSIGNYWENPLGLRSGEESRPVQELVDENGVVANVKSFFAGISDSIRRWGLKTISPPAILHATEPLGRFPHTEMHPTSALATKLTAIVGKVMELYYENNVVAEDAKTCSGVLEEQTIKLVKLLKLHLKESLCVDDGLSAKEQKFCNFYFSHPKLATLMVFTKLEVDPVGVALMRTSTSELCAPSNGNLVHSVHQMEKLARRLRLSSLQVGLNGFPGYEHEHEQEHEQEHNGLYGLFPGHKHEHEQEHHSHEHAHHEYHEHNHEHALSEHVRQELSHFGKSFQGGQSCKDCYLQGIRSLMKDIKARLYSTCVAPSACMVETCAFVKEHKFLARTYMVLKTRLWEIISLSCASSCRSSPSNILPLGMLDYTHTAVSQSQAPNLPRFGRGFIRRSDAELPMGDADMPVSHTIEPDSLFFRRSSRCQKGLLIARQLALNRAIQLRGNFLRSSDIAGSNGLEGNGQAHLVIVVNGHPFGPSDIRDIFSNLQYRMSKLRDEVEVNSRSDSDVFKPFHEHTLAGWKTVAFQSADEQVRREEDNANANGLADKPEEQIPFFDVPNDGRVLSAVSSEDSVGETTASIASETNLGEYTTSSEESTANIASDSDLGESTMHSEDSTEEGFRAAM